VAVLGHRYPRAGGSRNDIWLFAADGSEAAAGAGHNLSERHDLMPGSGMGSDITPGEPARLWATPDGRHILFTAPIHGSYELWRIAIDDGKVDRITDGHHYLSGWHAVPRTGLGVRVAAIRSDPTALGDVHVVDLGSDGAADDPAGHRRLTRVTPDMKPLRPLPSTSLSGSSPPSLAPRRRRLAPCRPGPRQREPHAPRPPGRPPASPLRFWRPPRPA